MPNTLGTPLGQLTPGVAAPPRFGAGQKAQPQPGFLRIVVYDPVTGQKVIDPLPHPHASKWEVRVRSPGATSGSVAGNFEVPLYTPANDEYKKAKLEYDKLAEGQRVEGYYTTSGENASGAPAFSGIIRQLPNAMTGFSIRGVDSIHLLALARTNRTEFFLGTTDVLADNARRAYQLVWGDDGTLGVGAYAVNNGWTAATDSPSLNLPVYKTSTNGAQLLIAKQPAANYTDFMVDAIMQVNFNTTVAPATTSFGLIAAWTDSLNYIYAVATIRAISAVQFELDFQIWSVVAGAPTPQTTSTVALIELQASGRYQLQLRGLKGSFSAGTFKATATGADYLWRLTVNGYDPGCTWVQTATSPSGASGIYFATSGAVAGSPTCWATQITHRSRLPVFQQGIWNAGFKTISQQFSKAPNLDLLAIAEVTEGFVHRKTPGAGLNNDVLDFGPVKGTETAGQTPIGRDSVVRFEWKRNLTDISIEPNADPLATDISMQLSPSSNSSGYLEWHSIPAMKKYGILVDTVQAQLMADWGVGLTLAQAVASSRSRLVTAKKLKVLRDAETLGQWRELDWIIVHAPNQGLVNARMQVMGYTFTEGSVEMDIIADQFPIGLGGLDTARMWQTIDALASGTANLTPSSSSGLIFDSRAGAPMVFSAYGGYQGMDATVAGANGRARLRFYLPTQIVMIQQVTVSFSLQPYRTYSSFNITGTGAGSSHSHSHNHASASHSHTITIFTTGIVGATMWTNAGAGQIMDSGLVANTNIAGNATTPGATGTDATAEASHTHTVSGSSVLGIATDASGTNVHMWIDGVDQTASFPGGPWTGGQDLGPFDITKFILGGGWHEIQWSCGSGLGGIIPQMQAFVLCRPF